MKYEERKRKYLAGKVRRRLGRFLSSKGHYVLT